MCDLCDGSDEMQSCPDCGRLICFEHHAEDDVCAPAYVTASGDLYCSTCGRRHDKAEEDECADVDGNDDAFVDHWGDDDCWDDEELDEDAGDEDEYCDRY